MATALDVVTRALRKATVLPVDEVAPADMAAHALDALNDMIFAWKLAGVDTSHVALALSDTFPLGDEYLEGTTFLLASRLAPDYQAPVGFDADDWFRKMQAAYVTANTVDMTIDTCIVVAPSRTGWRL